MIPCDECGQRLVDAIDEHRIVIRGRIHQFRRTTDHIVCENCGATRSVNSIRAEAIAHGDLAPTVDDFVGGDEPA